MPAGLTSWLQGNTAIFPSNSGEPASYIGANFNSTTGTNTINDWLVTPKLAFQNGSGITFFTRTVEGSPFPDRIELRHSTAGPSLNGGTSPETVGDFTTVLLTVNEDLLAGGYSVMQAG